MVALLFRTVSLIQGSLPIPVITRSGASSVNRLAPFFPPPSASGDTHGDHNHENPRRVYFPGSRYLRYQNVAALQCFCNDVRTGRDIPLSITHPKA